MIKLKEKISYGIGTAGYNIGDSIIVGYLTLFCTDVVGISPGILAVFLLIPKITDIITDFILMHFIGKTRTRFGTYRPWLLSVIPMSICCILLFYNPSFLQTFSQGADRDGSF